MTLYLVRHGLAEAGVADLDPGLAERGHQQAEAVARFLATSNADRLIVSPLRRTRETAAPIARVLKIEPEIREEVAEVFDPNMPAEERRNMIGPFMAGHWSKQPAHLQAWRKRVVDVVLEAGEASEAAGKDLIVVSHYIAIGVIIGEALGDDRVVPVPMANASITSLRVEGGRFAIIEAVATTHLDPEMISGVHTAMAGRG